MITALVLYIVKQFVQFPDAVRVEVVKSGDVDLIEIAVDERDRGKVIGRNGQTIKSLRMLVHSIAPADRKLAVDIAK